jgi:hypothetical protein
MGVLGRHSHFCGGCSVEIRRPLKIPKAVGEGKHSL